MKNFILLILITIATTTHAQETTYCNPMNLDYGYTPIPNFSESGRHRATADPVIVLFKGDYYLFSTNQWGYWHSPDLLNWTFVSRHFLKPYHHVYDDLCAPAAWVMGDTLFVFGSTYSKNFPIWMSTNPKANEWKEAIDSLEIGGWDPGFFLDDDNRLYMYNGSSNRYPSDCEKTIYPAKISLCGLIGVYCGCFKYGLIKTATLTLKKSSCSLPL